MTVNEQTFAVEVRRFRQNKDCVPHGRIPKPLQNGFRETNTSVPLSDGWFVYRAFKITHQPTGCIEKNNNMLLPKFSARIMFRSEQTLSTLVSRKTNHTCWN